MNKAACLFPEDKNLSRLDTVASSKVSWKMKFMGEKNQH